MFARSNCLDYFERLAGLPANLRIELLQNMDRETETLDRKWPEAHADLLCAQLDGCGAFQ
jgi:hypothetical protein